MVCTNESLTKRAKHHRKLLNEFGKQWRHEYLLSIRQSTKANNTDVADVIAVGDIVILKNESTKRIFWKIAKVEELIRSEDDGVRSAKIRVLNSDNRRSIIMRRPIQHSIPLEIRAATGKDNNASEEPPKAEEPIEEPEKNAAKAMQHCRKEESTEKKGSCSRRTYS